MIFTLARRCSAEISYIPPAISLNALGEAKGVHRLGSPDSSQISRVRFNRTGPTVHCRSPNLALKDEEANGDNLLCTRDVALSAFAIEALYPVAHFNFQDSTTKRPKSKYANKAAENIQQAAASAGWCVGTDDGWSHKFLDEHDLHFNDRKLFVAV